MFAINIMCNGVGWNHPDYINIRLNRVAGKVGIHKVNKIYAGLN